MCIYIPLGVARMRNFMWSKIHFPKAGHFPKLKRPNFNAYYHSDRVCMGRGGGGGGGGGGTKFLSLI